MTPILLTLTLVLVSSLIAVPLGILWGVSLSALDNTDTHPQRYEWKHPFRLAKVAVSRCLIFLFTACLLMLLSLPLYIHASGWEATAGKFGWLPILQRGERFWFQGVAAAGWIHGIYGAAWIAFATFWSLRRRPHTVDRCARLDLEPNRIAWLVDIPLVIGWIIAAIAWNAVLASTEMTVADLYGVGTLADIVYKIYALDPRPFPVLAAVLLPAVLTIPVAGWIVRKSRLLSNARRAGDGVESYRCSSESVSKGNRAIWFVWALSAALITLLVAVVPFTSLILKAGWTVSTSMASNGQVQLEHSFTFHQFAETVRTSLGSFSAEFAWTVQLALTTCCLALPFAFAAAAIVNNRPRLRNVTLFLMLLLALIPGPVISLIVIQTFNRPILATLYDRTLIPSAIAVLPRAVPAAYLILRAAYRGLDSSVVDCAAIDACRLWRRLLRIDLPRLIGPLWLAMIVVALIACADLSATLLVLPPSVSTVASRLFGLLHSGVRHQEAGLALVSTFCFAAVSAIVVRLVR